MTQSQPPQPPDVGSTPAQPATPGMAKASLVLGITSIIPCVGFITGLLAVIFGIIVVANRRGGRGLATAGIITGGLGMLVAPVVLFASALFPALISTRGLAKRAICGGNLNGIGKGVAMYCAENDDAWPTDLTLLIDSGMIGWDMLQCPAAKWHRKCDYFYLPPRVQEPQADVSAILACDFKANHGGQGRNVLLGIYVKWMTEKQFQAELAKPQNAAFAAALRQIEGP